MLHGEMVVVEVTEGRFKGRGECERNDVFEPEYPSVTKTVESCFTQIENGLSRQDLQNQLPPGNARNAIDCALFELEAQQKGISVRELAGLKEAPVAITTAFTLSLGSAETMAEAARHHIDRPLLKLKLGRAGDLERVRAVRNAVPETRLIIDANMGWTFDQLVTYAPELKALGVEMIEQPLRPQDEHLLDTYEPVLPVVADESCIDRSSLSSLIGRYQGINIKLDKSGGLTEALALLHEAKTLDFEIMVGCMVGTSLAMTPALLLAEQARWVDLDGPLLLAADHKNGLCYRRGVIYPSADPVWG
jgi:L-alanine-DL-glutamate epimerase-like enolase superfamily enzyme